MDSIRAIVFDTFGTVVDWRTSIVRHLNEFGNRKEIQVDWQSFTDAWRAGYQPGMDQVRNGQRPWVNIDLIHRERLDQLLAQFGIDVLTEGEKADLNRVWHRLDPWPDSVPGIGRLKQRYIVSTFSNGSFACLVNMAKYGGLPWDCVFCADIVRHFKPDPETYLGVIEFLGVKPQEVMLAAAHNYDLRHGQMHGMRTAYVNRPTEFGPNQTTDLKAGGDWDIVVGNISLLADKLGC